MRPRSPLLFLASLGAVLSLARGALPAFPGAEGFGTDTPGGRGGKVIAVTTLAAEGPGSLAAALRTKGPRIVVFRVGGTIRLARDLNLDEPFATIAGQTAPGDGICILGGALRIRTHDVVVRHLRFRVGDDLAGPDPDNRDGVGIGNPREPVHHVVLDHCSVSWAIDENVSLWHLCHDITVQWCLIAEALEHSLHPKGAHGMGLLVGDHAQRVSVHHNLFAHNQDRNPLLKGDTSAEVINNVIYNWRWFATGLTDREGSGPQRADIVGNTYLPGPQTHNRFGVGLEKTIRPGSAVFLRDNTVEGAPSDAAPDDEWKVAVSRAPFRDRSAIPTVPGSGLTAQSATDALPQVLAQAGAVLPRRDAVDARIVASVRERTGHTIDSPRAVGAWPVYRSAPPPADADGDGTPDAWEQAHGLNPHDARDASTAAPDGFTWIERYLASIGPAG